MADTKISAMTVASNLTNMVLPGEALGVNQSYTTALFDARYAQLTGATFTGTVSIALSSATSTSFILSNTVGAGSLYVGTGGGTNIVSSTNFSFRTDTSANIIAGSTAGTIIWSLTATTGSVSQAGTLSLPAASSSLESLIVAHGAAPSAPTNGSIWTTTSGLFIRINGATIQAAPLASPGLTGTPTAPTATAGTNTTQIATTAFVTTAVAAVPTPNYGTGNAGLAYGGVGTYILGFIGSSLGIVENSTYAGSTITPAGLNGGAGTAADTAVGSSAFLWGGSALSGTWRAMGHSNLSAGSARDRATLFLRIS